MNKEKIMLSSMMKHDLPISDLIAHAGKFHAIQKLYHGNQQWQRPDAVVFTGAIPLSGTGKMLKNKLREQFKHPYR
jgi:fatty-acyl-CoA synthase